MEAFIVKIGETNNESDTIGVFSTIELALEQVEKIKVNFSVEWIYNVCYENAGEIMMRHHQWTDGMRYIRIETYDIDKIYCNLISYKQLIEEQECL